MTPHSSEAVQLKSNALCACREPQRALTSAPRVYELLQSTPTASARHSGREGRRLLGRAGCWLQGRPRYRQIAGAEQRTVEKSKTQRHPAVGLCQANDADTCARVSEPRDLPDRRTVKPPEGQQPRWCPVLPQDYNAEQNTRVQVSPTPRNLRMATSAVCGTVS